MKKVVLDLEAVRERLARANPFGVPRWIAADVSALLAEIDRLRFDAEGREDRMRSLMAEVARQRAEVARVEHARSSIDTALMLERNRERAAVVAWLRAFATEPLPALTSPVKQVERAFAGRTADLFEQGAHRTTPTPEDTQEEEP